MKKLSFLIVVFLIISNAMFAQVAVNTDGSQPHPSAILDAKSTSKGFLPPRMTQAQLNAISNPADGLMVYCLDCGSAGSGAMAMCINGIWHLFNINCINPASPVTGIHIPSITQIVWNWSTVPEATGYKWNTTNNYGTATDMGATTTKTETGLTCNTLYTRYAWAYGTCGNSAPVTLTQSTSPNPPGTPTAGTHIPTNTQITWNWNPVFDATGYKWSSTNDFVTAIDMATATTKTETGLTCNTVYTRYAWAYGMCGNSAPVTLSQTTTLDPPAAPIAGTHVPSPTAIIWNWNAVSGATGYKWNNTEDFSTAIDMGPSLTKTESGLSCHINYTRWVWAYNTCGNSTATPLQAQASLSGPTTGTHVTSPDQITWNWNPVFGAAGYKWSSTADYATATDMGTATTVTQTGLICVTAYTSYVWAYSISCGESPRTTLNQTTSACVPCPGTATVSYGGQTYHTVQIGTQCWMKESLNNGTRIDGYQDQTDNSAIEKYCYNDYEPNCDVYGGMYQWAEAVQYRNGATNTTSWSPVPTGNVQGICPAGWHLPADAEWTTLSNSIGGQAYAGGNMKETGLSH